ncbi:MAG: RNA polymerase sigma factor FliA [Gammaproteobacteria bacterium]|nr:MAG: RNA polymerase sigma factor FliA [Gammaproteobacteria bacterium]
MNGYAMYSDSEELARSELLAKHAPLVKKIAFHLLGRLPANVQAEDLIQAGMLGLLDAVKNYDPSQGASFETYAGIRVRGSMLDEVRSGDWTPRSVHRKQRELAEAARRVENRLGREAQDHEVAAEMGIGLDEYHQIIADATSARVFSLDAPLDEDDSREIPVPSDEDDPLRSLEKERFKAALTEAIEQLPDRERLVMALYYDEELNLREIGEILGVSESRVCQIHGEAVKKLRARMRDWMRRDAG